MKEWKVLPTDDRFLDLTEEQREYMWINFLIDNPKIERQITNRFHDPDFHKEWDALDSNEEVGAPEEGGTIMDKSNEDDEDFSDIEEMYGNFLKDHPELEVKNAKYEEMMNNIVNGDDEWTEVE